MKKMCKILKVVISLFLFFLPVKFYAENFYWEESKNISEGYACFPRTVTNGNANYVFWQEVDKKNENIFLSCRYFEKGEWKTNARFAGPFPYSGDIPDIYTVSVSLKGIVSAAVLANANEIHIFSSKDNAHSFSKVALESKSVVLVAPRIYSNCQNGFTLFTSFAKGENFHVNVSYSQDAISWSGFAEFGPTKSMRNSFMPVLFPLANKDYVVFQSQTLYEERLSYQLYLSTSLNHSNWSTPILLTGGDSFSLQENRDAFLYNNQRPTLCSFEEKLFMAWERSRLNSTNSDIWVLQVDQGGTTLTKAEKIGDGGSASSANIFSHNGKLSLTWFDTKRGVSTVRFAQKTGLIWNEIQLSHGNVEAVFPFPIVQNFSNEKNVLSFVWQESKDEKSSGIFFLTPDTSVLPPTVTPLTFAKGKRTKQKSAIFSVSLPNDSSGVSGYSWSFSKDRNVEPEHIVKNLPQDKTISVTAETDGEHYLKVCALDYAGNWSESAEEVFYLDLTSPTSPILADYEKDDYGFVKTNTMSFAWRQNESDTDVAGYSYNLQYIAPIAPDMAENKTHTIAYSKDEVFSYIERLKLNYSSVKADSPPLRILGTEKTVSFKNRKNGLYVFSVSAIDEVGNVSVPSSCFLIFNKYLPETVVTSLKSSSDIFGNVSLEVFGSGFLYDGTISEIYISRNGKEPYDAVLSQSDGAFVVASDNRISSVKLQNLLKEGSYKIILNHTDRGLFVSPVTFSITENGTVKIEKQYSYEPPWKPVVEGALYHVNIEMVVLWSIIVFLIVLCLILIFRIINTVNDILFVRKEALAILQGDIMSVEKQQKVLSLNRYGLGLRFKLIFFTIGLIGMVVLLTAIPLGRNMIRLQERTLTQSLKDRVLVLLDSVATSSRTYLPQQNILELTSIVQQQESLSEASYITISGFRADQNVHGLNHVWATSDDAILQKIEGDSLELGYSALTEKTILSILRELDKLNDKASSRAGEIARNIVELNAEGVTLALSTDRASIARREEISRITQQLSTEFNVIMNELSNEASGAEPYYDVRRLDKKQTEYIFYRPVLYRQGSSNEYVHGVVFMEVSTKNLISSINSARINIIKTVLIIGLIAIFLGAAGAFVLATIIVKPLKEVVSHVSLIGNTSDKTKLQGKVLSISTSDEIGVLGRAVNDMTASLVTAAFDEKLMMDGKVVQQTFLPLSAKSDGKKETTAKLDAEKIQCFGYYEGASNVSGDYFDYKKLDDRWYVIIKCDASGHGVPAALIMTVVATLFRTYFSNWSFAKNGTRLNELVSKINDFIESLGIKGKFATIITCLFDTHTGDLYFCNAGDNIVHFYNSAKAKEEELVLTQTPAAGPLPSSLVEMKGGFKVEKAHLQKGDILFFYTDGIEEATRKFRSSDFSVTSCEEGREHGERHGNHNVGQSEEQFGNERISEIIECVFAKRIYTLNKYHNPVTDENLQFDFSKCDATLEDAILAVVSVEKVFRLYKSGRNDFASDVLVDKKIDAFLSKCFNLYDYYCNEKEDEDDSNYCRYKSVQEDEQLDDITLLAVRLV